MMPEDNQIINSLKTLTNGLVKTGSLSYKMCLKELDKISVPDQTVLLSKDLIDIDNIKFRCKSDERVRRLKLRDLSSLDIFWDVIQWCYHLDQIFLANIIIWTHMNGLQVFLDLKTRGFFNSIQQFLEISIISSFCKRFPFDDSSKQIFAEINVLTGYFQNDIIETDWESELLELANGGGNHNYVSGTKEIIPILNLLCPPKPRQKPFLTLYDFIDNGQWLTPGSSSIGKISWSFGGEKGKFKARKNMLSLIYTTQDLYELCINWNGKLTSKAFTKDELSKRRIATASNIESYLCEAYLLYNMGHIYKTWDYITLDEPLRSEHRRTIDICNTLKNKAWSMPFDFKNFDHQPTTEEISIIMSHDLGGVQVPSANKSEWVKIKNKVINSYSNNTISMTISNDLKQHSMTGGLPSGVRWTSLLGNQWNMIMTYRARSIATAILGYDPVLTLGVRGDDTYILASKAAELVIFREAYAMINAIGLDSKFGIHQHICEFLRVEMKSSGEAVGWSNRSIPTITQRKPWNNEPRTIISGVEAVAQAIYTCERRRNIKLDTLHTINKVKWSRYTKQSIHWLELPRLMGGFGIYDWKGYKPDIPWPSELKKSRIIFDGLIPYKELPWLDVSVENRKIMAQNAMMLRVSNGDISVPKNDDIPAIRKLRTKWKKSLPTWTPSMYLSSTVPSNSYAYWPPKMQSNGQSLLAAQIISDFNLLPKNLDVTLGEILLKETPEFFAEMKLYETMGWHRTNAISIAMGQMPTSSLTDLHPKLVDFVRDSIINAGILNRKGRDKINNYLHYYTIQAKDAVKQSSGYKLYQY